MINRKGDRMRKRQLFSTALVMMVFLMVAIVSVAVAQDEKQLMMATTTSTDNTGLLDYLVPKFQSAKGIELKWTATGTGNALKLGENCDVDVLMVHAPDAEAAFVEKGFGTDRLEIMYNDFVIIGPDTDPAGIKGKSVKEALDLIRKTSSIFVSRGDDSGTHKKEMSLWKEANISIPEKENWYVETGQGMLATINVAAEKNAYTMADRGTYIKYEDTIKGTPPLKILLEGETVLLNQYSVIAVNPEHCANVKFSLAMEFINWISGPEAQALIKEFKLLGKPLFIPNAKEQS